MCLDSEHLFEVVCMCVYGGALVEQQISVYLVFARVYICV